jgi:hypothetical protein
MSKKLRHELGVSIRKRAMLEAFGHRRDPSYENGLKQVGKFILLVTRTQQDLDKLLNRAIECVYVYTREGHKDSEDKVRMGDLILKIGQPFAKKARSRYGNLQGNHRAIYKTATNTSIALQMGAHILYSFELLGLVERIETRGKNKEGHSDYFILSKDDRKLTSLRETIPVKESNKYPQKEPYNDWHGSVNAGFKLIKTNDQDILKSLNPEDFPTLFKAVNQSQRIGWKVNWDVAELFEWALRTEQDAFGDIWEMTNPQAKESKLREATSVLHTAKVMGDIPGQDLVNDEGEINEVTVPTDNAFYHLYYYDFRGRKYPATAYLHEQGTDAAKGLLLTAEQKPLGKDGYQWLLLNAANNWAGNSGREDGAKTDKIALYERVSFAEKNLDTWLEWAGDPFNNKGWMSADKPWQFISTIMEIYNAHTHDNPFDYETGFVVYIDGTNNGCQHLAAITRDEDTGEQVNVTRTPNFMDETIAEREEVAGDLYAYVAESVWKQFNANVTAEQQVAANKYIEDILALKAEITSLTSQLDTLRKREKKDETEIDRITTRLYHLKLRTAPKARLEGRVPLALLTMEEAKASKLISRIRKNKLTMNWMNTVGRDFFKKSVKDVSKYLERDNRALFEKADSVISEVFWMRITDKKEQRKIVKRNVMTLPYGGTEYGLGEQQIKDARKHDIELLLELEHKWGAYMGRKVYAGCEVAIPRPMAMLKLFEEAGNRAESRGEVLRWSVPGTGFPVSQYYMQGRRDKINAHYGDNNQLDKGGLNRKDRLQLRTRVIEYPEIIKGKQAQGASPNVIHSLDAAHLAMTQMKCSDNGFNLITVHDSFGSHPTDMQNLFKYVRDCFVDLYSSEPLEHLKKELQVEDIDVPLGNLEVDAILENEFAFS